MNIQLLRALKTQIKQFNDLDNKIIAFGDGPIDINEYRKSEFPIIIVLQEPYTDEEKYQFYLKHPSDCPNSAEDKKAYKSMRDWKNIDGCAYGYKTYLPLVSIVSQILTGETTYQKRYDENSYSIFVKNTAVINVKKVPNAKVASSGNYVDWLKRERNLSYMSHQIAAYEPKLVIMANIVRSMPGYHGDGVECEIFGRKIHPERNFISRLGNRILYDDQTIFIDVDHPSRLSNIRKEEIIKMANILKKDNKLEDRTYEMFK